VNIKKAKELQSQVFGFCKDRFSKEFKGLIKTGYEANINLYNLTLQHLAYLKEREPQGLKKSLVFLIDVLPTKQKFELKHKGQLSAFGDFLEFISGDVIDKKLFDEECWNKFIEVATLTDRRYPDINKSYDSLKRKLLNATDD